jgi:hypothetical protein
LVGLRAQQLDGHGLPLGFERAHLQRETAGGEGKWRKIEITAKST